MQALVLWLSLFGVAWMKDHRYMQAGFARCKYAACVLGFHQRHIRPMLAKLAQRLRNSELDSLLRNIRKGVICV